MADNNIFDVIIVGGSYSGLSAAMALGRALRKVLVLDDGKPCNRQTPHSHNFLTNDGKTPAEIAALASQQVRQYNTISFSNGTAIHGNKTGEGFDITVSTGESFGGRKLIFATGIKDNLPGIEGLESCWGISAIHCPFCHGYEVRGRKTGILGNGDPGFDFARLISNWTRDLTLFTNGPSTLSAVQREKLQEHQIAIVDKEILTFEHKEGYIQNIVFKDSSRIAIEAIYTPGRFEQHCKIPENLGCEITEDGYIKVDSTYETTMKGIFAVGDNASKMRTVSNAVATGTVAGITISKLLIAEEF